MNGVWDELKMRILRLIAVGINIVEILKRKSFWNDSLEEEKDE